MVVILFRDRLQLIHPIAWLYLVTLAINVTAAVLGVMNRLRLRPSRLDGEPLTGFMRFLIVGFIVFVGFLGIWGLTAEIGDLATNGEIFPEVMSPFTLRSFGAFYSALTVGMISLLFEKQRLPFLNYAFLAFGLILIITTAALVYLRLFDFNSRPFGALYFAAYIAAGLLCIYLFWKYGTGQPAARQNP